MTHNRRKNPYAGERGESEWIYEPYDLKIFESPADLMEAIRIKANEQGDDAQSKGLSRMLATYDWDYKADGKNPDMEGLGDQWGVEMHRKDGEWHLGADPNHARGLSANDDDYFFHPWNYQLDDTAEEKAVAKFSTLAWAEKPHTIDEIGSTFTIQGFDLNYAGVILGPSVRYNPQTQRVEFHHESSKNKKATNKRESKRSYAMENLQNELNVLMTRGVHGLYIFAFDPALREELKKQCKGE